MSKPIPAARGTPLKEPQPPVYASARISSKGQITLPAAMRRQLRTDRVRIEMHGETITLSPARDLAGALKAYAQPGRYTLEEETDLAWELEVRERHGKHLRR
ncbi:MAG: AbrB/MazE/SpoVT family DNA-binding domain-containing protein [Gammaproteobacteria bacterium]|nr:AbrB/MazE/SpoVT family DNA-binding domain-containing protein [Gammaproteobacteria bacterium]